MLMYVIGTILLLYIYAWWSIAALSIAAKSWIGKSLLMIESLVRVSLCALVSLSLILMPPIHIVTMLILQPPLLVCIFSSIIKIHRILYSVGSEIPESQNFK